MPRATRPRLPEVPRGLQEIPPREPFWITNAVSGLPGEQRADLARRGHSLRGAGAGGGEAAAETVL